MSKRNLTIIIIFGLVTCGDPKETPQVTTEETEIITTTNNSDVTQQPKRKPLELIIPVDNNISQEESDNFTEEKKLPDFFNQDKKKQNSKISGKLLNDPTNPDYIDSVEGAEISLEIKTN